MRRDEGESIKEIARRLGVSPSTVSLWVHDIVLTTAQQQALLQRNPAYNRQMSGTKIQAANRRAERIAYQHEGRILAAEGEASHLAGCMLYWAEGEKARNTLRFSNSDPDMVRFFVSFLRKHFNVRNEQIRVTCYLFADHLERQREIEQYWLDVMGLHADSLCKSHVNVYSKYSEKKRANRLPYGTVKIAVNRTHIVQSIYGSIQEYAGFERPAWLE